VQEPSKIVWVGISRASLTLLPVEERYFQQRARAGRQTSSLNRSEREVLILRLDIDKQVCVVVGGGDNNKKDE
jgi:hypothetical protein